MKSKLVLVMTVQLWIRNTEDWLLDWGSWWRGAFKHLRSTLWHLRSSPQACLFVSCASFSINLATTIERSLGLSGTVPWQNKAKPLMSANGLPNERSEDLSQCDREYALQNADWRVTEMPHSSGGGPQVFGVTVFYSLYATVKVTIVSLQTNLKVLVSISIHLALDLNDAQKIVPNDFVQQATHLDNVFLWSFGFPRETWDAFVSTAKPYTKAD